MIIWPKNSYKIFLSNNKLYALILYKVKSEKKNDYYFPQNDIRIENRVISVLHKLSETFPKSGYNVSL